MKRTIVAILICFIIGNTLKAQSGFARYQFTPNESNPYYSTKSYELYFNQSRALLILIDSLDKMIVNETNKQVVSVAPYTKAFCNYATDSCILYKNYGDNKKYQAAKKLYQVKWEIDSSESNTFFGYQCYKAIRHFWGNGEKETIIAWFCPKIKTNANPSIAQGLPGLIFEEQSKFGTIKMTEIILKPIDNTIFEVPVSKKVSIDKYLGTKSKTMETFQKINKASEAEINKD